ncbi:MAG: magnesium transporter CorA family protein [Lentisphaeria bacterium]|nr:magnesium transporter CorA family protein [Lentisphaeria bacterium]
MLRCYDLVDGRVQSCPEGQTGMIQIYSAPTAEEKEYLTRICGIDAHTLESALDEDAVSRVEYEERYTAVIMKRPRNFRFERNLSFKIATVGAFLFPDRIIVLQDNDMPLFEHGRMPMRGNTLQGILLRLLHHATQHFLQHLRIIRNISEEIENKIAYAVTNKSLMNVFALRKSLTFYESATSANLLLLRRLRNDSKRIGFSESERDFLEDVTIENEQCDNLANIYAEILAGMSNARMSVSSNNLAVIMKYLAIINVVFMPLTVITGIGGMSEFTAMTEGLWWPHAYGALTVGMIIIGLVTYLIISKMSSNAGSSSGKSRKRSK